MKKIMRGIEKELAPYKKILIEHPLYKQIQGVDDIRVFMEQHVFAVWDFMSLVKKLQVELTCTQLPWRPSTHPTAGRLINEIVWGEETDLNKDGEIMSHFEMYLQSMEEAGANTAPITEFLAQLNQENNVEELIAKTSLPEYVSDFLSFTFSTIKENKLHVIAAVFTFGREDLIPDMFIEMVKNLRNEGVALHHLIYYLDRHIEVDGDEHGPMALKMMEELCAGDPIKIQEAIEAAKKALKMRIKLWDGILSQLPSAVLI
ncbi:DUF3050 domain-containing protein [Flavobacteriaceae bacterium]|nr:DUF3050 domain-containing protein [Flavobacteriaceae bacterium]MDA9330805.1 DUF3050 domain-containing protein [Flavobacteriaceae bacterium]MDA9984466.1 DUF3050 domain-containing protein [Flavobacteriaceae bacterium]MDB2672925.1 DUF3050 domain-containing protein [Flavobacteriaceae bacterium]